MPPTPTADELWGTHLMPASIVVDVLMPNGLIISVFCNRESTIEHIKECSLREARNCVLDRLISKEKNDYIFVAVTQEAKIEEFYDETRRLCDLRLFHPILKLVEPVGNKEENILNSTISQAIGRPINEFDNMKDPEVIDFRRKVLSLCRDTVSEREALPLREKLNYAFSPDLDEAIGVMPINSHKLEPIVVHCWNQFSDGSLHQSQLKIAQKSTPKDIIFESLKDLYKVGSNLNSEDLEKMASDNTEKYVLKVNGMDQYLLGNHPLLKYKYIQRCLLRGQPTKLLLIQLSELYKLIPVSSFIMPSFLRRTQQQQLNCNDNPAQIYQAIANHQLKSLWKIDSMLRITISLATYVNVKDVDKIYVKSGIYHGTEALCEPRCTKFVEMHNPRWDEVLEFDLYIPDIPRNARLCFSICAVNYRKKRIEEHCAIGWGNLQLFDFKNILLSEKVTINLWPMPSGHTELLNPFGCNGSNPNKDVTCLHLMFDRFSTPVIFPPEDQIEKYSSFISNLERQKNLPAFTIGSRVQNCDAEMTAEQEANVKEILQRDQMSELTEQEKDTLWSLRNQLRNIPDSLPKLLNAIKWNTRDEVSQLYVLLKSWPSVKLETALELLECKYADMYVRKYVVKWLDECLTDELLLQYLLQFVQVLKKEPYLDSDLSNFLLRRAIMNDRIGHFFFWHLKAEMHESLNSLRFGILLEAYCRGLSANQLKSTEKQVAAMEKLERLTDLLKENKDDPQNKRLKLLMEQINRQDYIEALQNLKNPLNSYIQLGSLISEEFRIMDSAKRPLWLVWSNPDKMAEFSNCPTNSVIFKNGDDLRQDMLTLQVIKIMDMIWKRNGLDLKVLPYTCLATGNQVGIIEVVKNAKTVMHIQRTAGRMAAYQFDCTQLHSWIKDKCKDKYDQAVDNFMRSCVGYCVATFILGIGDRNPDNIMLNEDGQIFHIDFGHFLGHYKKKFGINRERVPFVLTDDFINVITKGSDNQLKSKEFDEFQQMCCKAYTALHNNANLLITMFTIMLSTGIPELQSMEDIEHLRQTLQVEKNTEDALKYFTEQLDKAHVGAWTTKLDWFFHCLKHSKT